MAWIETINEDEATGPIAKIYKGTMRSWGGVDNIIKVHSLNHNVLRCLMLFYKSVMHGETDITLGQKEMIAVTVSALNECHYWIQHHGEGLLREIDDEALVEAIKRDYREAKLTDADRAMLDYVRVLTLRPMDSAETDIIRLRENGFTDKAILEINQIACFFAWCNRSVDGLGVQLEDFWDQDGVSNI